MLSALREATPTTAVTSNGSPENAAWLSCAPPRNVLHVGTTSEHFEGEGWLFATLSDDRAVLLTFAVIELLDSTPDKSASSGWTFQRVRQFPLDDGLTARKGVRP